MKDAKGISPNRYKKLSHAMFLLIATASLFACTQPNTNVQANDNTQPNIEVSATTSLQSGSSSNQTSPAITPVSTQTTLLQNVSATVYKDANCGCCKEWIGYATANGLNATAHDVADLSIFKERYGVPPQMQSCHTAVTTDGYVFEGHVPAKYIAQFLKSPPNNAIGLAVPGMPVGSPGMEYQDQFMPYQVMQINKDGSTAVYANIDFPEAQL